MKKSVMVVLSLLTAGMLFAQGGAEAQPEAAAPAPAVEETPMTYEELCEAAKAEGALNVYAASSRSSVTGDNFGAQVGIKVTTTQLKDTEMVDKVSKEAAANLDGADVILAQDGARIYPELIDTGYVVSYTPASLKDVIPEEYQNPQVWDLCIKCINYNAEKWGQPITNIWQLTEPEFSGRVQMKDPTNEAVNMNFFTMITRDDWAQKIADAYEHLYGKKLELTTPNAGYEWIKALYDNGVVLGKSDTTINENVGAKGQDRQMIGLYTLNKLRANEAKNLASTPCHGVEPFVGFYYPIYALITSNCRHPNAARAYIEYQLGPEAWADFNQGIGDYSPVPSNVNRFDETPLSEWAKELVLEDPQWCAEHRAEVEEFIAGLL